MSDAWKFVCPGCREFVPGGASSCPFCGRPLDPRMRPTFIEEDPEPGIRATRRRDGLRAMLFGLGIMGLGLAITVVSYLTAGPGGGRHYIAYGLIIVGGLRLVLGLIEWAKA